MKTFLITFCIWSILACGPTHHRSTNMAPELAAQLALKKEELLLQIEPYIDEGWIDREDCDGLLWNTLATVGGVQGLNIHLAEYQPGEWHRRPEPCWTKEEGDIGSKSTISRDMLTGLLYYFQVTGDVQGVKDLFAYGREHTWVMGQPFPEMASRVLLHPSGIYLLAKLLQNFTSQDTPELFFPAVYLPVTQDYERHIQTLSLLLAIDLESQATDIMYDRLHEHVIAFPSDALFQAALGWIKVEHLVFASHLILDPNYSKPSYVRNNEAHFIIHQLLVIHVLQKVLI